MQGLVIENIANLYQVKVEEAVYKATARGKFKLENVVPVVGDYVQIEVTDEENKKAVINSIQKRQVYIKRPKLANITQIVFVVSSKEPKPDLLMLDKQLAFAEFLNVKAIIVLNKTDLDQKEEFNEIETVYKNIGYTVIKTEAKNNKGINKLYQVLQNNVNAFAGNSGVGKSTLINSLFASNVTQEGEISKKNKRGKNTTTSIKLYEINENTYIADTPGFSTFDILEIESRNLDRYFKEFKENIAFCEFVGCTHIKEENCGIKKAIEEGKIDKSRYERFCKIYQELKEKENRKW